MEHDLSGIQCGNGTWKSSGNLLGGVTPAVVTFFYQKKKLCYYVVFEIIISTSEGSVTGSGELSQMAGSMFCRFSLGKMCREVSLKVTPSK